MRTDSTSVETIKRMAVVLSVCSCTLGCYDRSDLVADGTVDTDTGADGFGGSDLLGDTDTHNTVDVDTETDTSISLMPDTEGWLDMDSNALRLQGAWYTYGGEGAVYSPAGDEQIFNDGKICFSGTAPVKSDVDGDGELDFETQYGAAIAFDMCSVGGPVPMTPTTRYPLGDCPFNPEIADQVVGISVRFEIGAVVYPENLWIVFSEGDERGNAYVMVSPDAVASGRAIEAYFSDAVTHWDPYMNPDGAVPSQIIAIQFQVPAHSGREARWDFCITELEAILSSPLDALDL